jgi:hypothetical protein
MTSQKRPKVISFALSGTTYQLPIDGEVKISAVNDSPPHVPTSGEQSAKSRSYHNVVSVKDIKNAFSHHWELDFGSRGGILDNLTSSTMDTRWGASYMAPAENNPTLPTHNGTLHVMPPTDATATRPGAKTGPNRNPHASIFYTGTTNRGVFTGVTEDWAADTYYLNADRWSGTAWSTTATLVAGSTDEALLFVADFEIHKGALCVLFDDGTGAQVSSSTTGATFSAFTNDPTTEFGAGSRLVDDGTTLYAFLNAAVGSPATFSI